ncbi:MAG: 4-hydroxybenzoate octaprenyltransferase [Pseudomonadota bacterium]
MAASKINGFIRLTRLDKPIGIYLLLWPTLWALWVAAEGLPDLFILGIFLLGVILMRSAGCAINDFADRNLDGQVERTKMRPLATGELMPKDAVLAFVVLSLIAFGLVMTLNALTIMLSIGGALLAAIYPFMKRYTHFPQVVLGAAFAWSIPMAFAAIRNEVPQVAWLLFMATVTWTVAYDTMYAMVDREYDKKLGIKSTAVLLGDADLAMLGVLHFLVALALVMVGQSLNYSQWYFMALAASWAVAIYQLYIMRHRQPEACFRAFLSNNWYGMFVFIGFSAAYTDTTALLN